MWVAAIAVASIPQVMVYLRHPNITTVMGAVVDETDEPKLVMEYMKHRSLYEMLHSKTVAIDSDMLLTFCKDVIRGMAYLHQCNPPVLHNDLKSGEGVLASEMPLLLYKLQPLILLNASHRFPF